MSKRTSTLVALIVVIMAMVVILIGNFSYNSKIKEVGAQAYKKHQVELEEDRKLEEQKKKEAAAEEKRIYDLHKGEELVYLPIGDSLAAGAYATTKEQSYVSVFSSLINKKMGYDVKVIDSYAISGSGLKDNAIPNLDHIIANKPDLITIELGTNDLEESKEKTYSTPEEFNELLSEFVSNLQKELGDSTKILLVTTWNRHQHSINYDTVITEVGANKNVPVVNIQSVWQNRTDTFGPEGRDTFLGESDASHPNDKGHSEIGNKIFENAYDLLK